MKNLLALLICLSPLCLSAGTINGHEYVDMGFPSGTMWATCNLGASSPEQPGNYYAWGELTGYSQLTRNFNWNTYQLCNGTNTSLNKYCTSSEYGTVDSQTILENPFEDGLYKQEYDNNDAANASWGLIWLIPTDEQMTELRNNTTYTIETINNVKCRKITSKLNGNSIIMPLAGYYEGTEHKNSGVYGNYWTSTLFTNPQQAYATWFPESGAMRRGGIDRCYAQSIRPVCIPITKLEIDPSEIEITWYYARYIPYGVTVTITPSNATYRELESDGTPWDGDNYLDNSPTQSFESYTEGGVGSTDGISISTKDGSELEVSCTVVLVSPFTKYGFDKDKIEVEYDPLDKWLGLQFETENETGADDSYVIESSEKSANPNECDLSWGTDGGFVSAYNATGKAKLIFTYTEFGDNQYAECEVEVTPGKCGEKLEYTVSHDQKKDAYDVHISGEGQMNNYQDEYFSYINYDCWNDNFSGDLNIYFDTDKITSIGNYAFYNCNTLHTIEIPASVTSIGSYAFADCPVLTSFTCLGTTPPTVDATAFENTDLTKCTLYVPKGSVSTYRQTDVWKNFVNFQELSPNVTVITYQSTDGKIVTPYNASSFFDASGNSVGIESNVYQNGEGTITFSGQVTTIGYQAFRSCTTLSTVTIPESVTTIGSSAFSRCSKLASVCLPSTLTALGDYAFYYCSKLSSIDLPDGLTSIGNWAFTYCSGLTSLTIPASVTSINQNAFKSCSGLSSIKVDSQNSVYDSRNNCNAIIETSTNILFNGCKNTVIPDGIVRIEDGAFKDCSGLSSMTIPNSVKTIGTQAFYNCKNMSELTISENMTEIGKDAFAKCTALMTIHAGKVPATIVESAFDSSTCTAATLYIPQGSKTAYQNASGWSGFINIVEEKATSITVESISLSKSSITIEMVDMMADYEAVPLSLSITPVTATIASIVWSTEDETVVGVLSETYETPDNCTTVMILPATHGTTTVTAVVTDVYGNQFTATCEVKVTPELRTIKCGDNVFADISYYHYRFGEDYYDINIYGTGEMYDNPGLPSPYIRFEYNVTIQEGVTSIGAGAFADNEIITEIILPQSIKKIGSGAFANCYRLESINISGVETIADDAFEGCDGGLFPYYDLDVSPSSLTMTIGDEFDLSNFKIERFYPNYATNKIEEEYLNYYSNDENIVCLEVESGLYFKAVSAGKTTIEVSPSDWCEERPIYQIIEVTVVDPSAVTDISKLNYATYFEPITANVGTTKAVTLNLKNAASIASFSADLVLPEGVTIATDEFGDPAISVSGSRTNSSRHSVSTNTMADGSIRILYASQTNKTIAAGDGEVATVVLNIDNTVDAGDYYVNLKNVVMVEADETAHREASITSLLTVKNYTLGDVNDDGEINVQDLVAVVNYIMETPTAGNIAEAADLNGDGQYDAVDYVAEVNLIMSQPVAKASARGEEMLTGSLDIQPISLNAGETVTAEVSLTDANATYTCVQMDLQPNAAIHLDDVESLQNHHSVTYQTLADGTTRILFSSMSNHAINDVQPLMRLTFTADAEAQPGDYTLTMIRGLLVTGSASSTELTNVEYSFTLNDATGIETLTDETAGSIYNLNGQLMQSDVVPSGIYVRDGKKMIVK